MINPIILDIFKKALPNLILLFVVFVIFRFKEKVTVRYIFASELGVRVTDEPTDEENMLLKLSLAKFFSRNYYGFNFETFEDKADKIVQYISPNLWKLEKPKFLERVKEIKEKDINQSVKIINYGFDDKDDSKLALLLEFNKKSKNNPFGKETKKVVTFNFKKDPEMLKDEGPISINKYGFLIDNIEIKDL